TTYRPIINSQEAISSPTVTHTLPVTTYRPIVSTPVASHQLSSQPVLAKPLLSRPLLSRPLLSRPILPRSGTSRQVTSYRPILTTGQTESTVAYRPTFEGSQYSAQTFVQPINYSYVQNTSVQGARHAGGYSMGQGLLGQPKVFVTGQPVRNLFRYITP
ncbi:MAG: hypothetical protein MPJ24_09935, partial [Pirellulaceae bacterium]|nr:hypothetical protein [Pirellulaceae bacterium]